MSSKLSGGQHMPQLDGLRTLAVAAVAWSHWMGSYQGGLEWGLMGVNLFFVLSGFLITGILLDSREGAAGPSGRWRAIRQFYTRRVLRIFPLFYMTLAVLALLNVRPVRETFFWHFCYLSNVYFFQRGAWHGLISHFWSLAVEEQFYLVWPYLMIFLPVRLVRPVVLGLIGLAPVYRVVMRVVDPDNPLAFVLTIGCLDALGIGALLAYAKRRSGDSLSGAGRLARRLLWIGLPAWGALEALNRWHLAPRPLLALQQTFLAMIFGWVILSGARGFKGWFGRFLQWSPMAYLGKISYGLYVFHNLTIYGIVFAVRDLHAPAAILADPCIRRLSLVVLTISVAALSWHLYEKPLNDLKRYFPYNAPGRARKPVAARAKGVAEGG
jgi:peptidoglycan/LPS O-acetylase OafA/YrhL